MLHRCFGYRILDTDFISFDQIMSFNVCLDCQSISELSVILVIAGVVINGDGVSFAWQITGFYDHVSTTLLSNVRVKYLDSDVDEDSVTKSDFKNYFNGSEMVIAGRLSDAETRTLSLQVLGDSADGNIVLSGDTVTNYVAFKGNELCFIG